jgi:hypothetical protein
MGDTLVIAPHRPGGNSPTGAPAVPTLCGATESNGGPGLYGRGSYAFPIRAGRLINGSCSIPNSPAIEVDGFLCDSNAPLQVQQKNDHHLNSSPTPPGVSRDRKPGVMGPASASLAFELPRRKTRPVSGWPWFTGVRMRFRANPLALENPPLRTDQGLHPSSSMRRRGQGRGQGHQARWRTKWPSCGPTRARTTTN